MASASVGEAAAAQYVAYGGLGLASDGEVMAPLPMLLQVPPAPLIVHSRTHAVSSCGCGVPHMFKPQLFSQRNWGR